MTHIVIGGGATGLAAAIELARRGEVVTVFEASRRLGGRAQSLEEDGFVTNLGPHALYRNAERRLEELGVTVRGGIPAAGLTMQVRDRLAELPVGVTSLAGCGALAWGDKWRVGALLARLPLMNADDLDRVSVAEWLDGHGFTGVARDLMYATVRISSYCNAPERLSAGAAVRQIRGALEGVRYLDGGWATIVEGLRERAEAHGVTIRTGAKVEALEVERGRAVALGLRGGERVEVDGVVLTLSPRMCLRLLGENASLGLSVYAKEATAVRAACLDVALRRLPRRHPSLILGTDEPIYLSIHSNAAELAPEGGGLIHVARYLAPGETVGPETRRELEGYLDMSQPGWREELVKARWAPAMTVMHAFPEARLGGASGRPASGDAGPPNVALAGDWVGAERMLFDACLASARGAAEVLVGRGRLGTARAGAGARAGARGG